MQCIANGRDTLIATSIASYAPSCPIPLSESLKAAGTRSPLERRPPVYARGARLGDLAMIRKLSTGQYRLYSRKTNPRTGKRRNLGTFKTRAAAEKHEREVQYFKRH